MGYNGKWIDSFNVSVIEDDVERPEVKGKILLETPDVMYIFDKDQWSEFKSKVNKV